MQAPTNQITPPHFEMSSFVGFSTRLSTPAMHAPTPSCRASVPASGAARSRPPPPLVKPAARLVKPRCPRGRTPPCAQTMYRIRDPKVSLDFYTRVLGMT